MSSLRSILRQSLSLALPLCLLLVTACSRVQIAYNSADFMVERYADDVLGLSSAQLARWEPTLEKSLAAHRSQELPHLTALLQISLNASQAGYSPSNVGCMLDEMEAVMRRHFVIATDLLAPLLADLEPDQVAKLKRTFDDEDQDAEQARANTSKDRAARATRRQNVSAAKWFLGSVTDEQKQILADAASEVPDTGNDWETYASQKQAGLIALLEARASEQEVHAYLTAWFVDNSELPASLEAARPELRASLRDMFVRLDQSLTSDQRAFYQRRLTRLRDDFMELQAEPKMAPLQCAPGF